MRCNDSWTCEQCGKRIYAEPCMFCGGVPPVDPRDAEIARLREQVAEAHTALDKCATALGNGADTRGASHEFKCIVPTEVKLVVERLVARAESAEAKLAALEAQCAGMREACEAAAYHIAAIDDYAAEPSPDNGDYCLSTEAELRGHLAALAKVAQQPTTNGEADAK